jgi:hypothetical protein
MVGDANEYIEVDIAVWNMHTAFLALPPAETLLEDNAPCARHSESGPGDIQFVD